MTIKIGDYILGMYILGETEDQTLEGGAEIDKRARETGDKQGMNKKTWYKTRSGDSDETTNDV